MARAQTYTPAQVIAAFVATNGAVSLAARHLGCCENTVLRYCERYPAVAQARDAQRSIMVDLAELKLLHAIENGEAWAIALCLKTLGKGRGYVERQELTGENAGPLVIELRGADDV